VRISYEEVLKDCAWANEKGDRNARRTIRKEQKNSAGILF